MSAAATIIVLCDQCGQRHTGEYDHDGHFGEGPIYAVICDADPAEWLMGITDYYTLEAAVPAP